MDKFDKRIERKDKQNDNSSPSPLKDIRNVTNTEAQKKAKKADERIKLGKNWVEQNPPADNGGPKWLRLETNVFVRQELEKNCKKLENLVKSVDLSYVNISGLASNPQTKLFKELVTKAKEIDQLQQDLHKEKMRLLENQVLYAEKRLQEHTKHMEDQNKELRMKIDDKDELIRSLTKSYNDILNQPVDVSAKTQVKIGQDKDELIELLTKNNNDNQNKQKGLELGLKERDNMILKLYQKNEELKNDNDQLSKKINNWRKMLRIK
jgi:hypothetical protein